MAERTKRIVAGLLIVVAVVVLMATQTGTGATFFLTVDELAAMGADAHGRRLTVSGAVLGDTIVDDPVIPRVAFVLAQVPGRPAEVRRLGGLAAALVAAVDDPQARRLPVVYGGVRPELLRHGAQAIVRGVLAEDGTFLADEVLLKCPTRYGQDLPDQVEAP